MTRGGFTLLELIVALLLTGIVVLLAHALLAGTFTAEAALRREVTIDRREADGPAWALEACHGTEVGAPGDQGFFTTPGEARFTSRMIVPSGEVSAVPARIAILGDRVIVGVGAATNVIADSVEDAALSYLGDGGGEGGWFAGWSSPVSAPLAIRLIWTRAGVVDTLLCPIGSRG